jgi:hypothetical protein
MFCSVDYLIQTYAANRERMMCNYDDVRVICDNVAVIR